MLHQILQLAEDGEKFWGTAKACHDVPQSITTDSIKGNGQLYESWPEKTPVQCTGCAEEAFEMI